MPFDSNLDPTREYTSLGFALLTELLVRPLMNFRHIAGAPGMEVVPDLADGMPDVSDDGLTYTFHIKADVRFAPPVDRAVTSDDIAYAFERAAAPGTRAQYLFYLEPIVGLQEFEEGTADSISGIETPDERTIVFHLDRPTGDFLYRLSLPATAPIPREVGSCFDAPSEYGTNLVSTGPFMIEGSDDVDATSCDTIQPASGFDPASSLRLVRNPEYDPATDDAAVRDPGFDAYHLSIEDDLTKTYAEIERGRIDLTTDDVGIDTVRRYVTHPGLRADLHVEDADRLWYIAMKLTSPPFDDVHVRRAANLVMDKDLLQRAWGGEVEGDVATQIVPPDLLGGATIDPYPSRHHVGDVSAARKEMEHSRYDHNGDGLCDADVCDSVLNIAQTNGQWEAIDEVVSESLAKIGIQIDTRAPDDPYSYIADARADMAMTAAPSWVKDYPDPFGIMGFLMSSANLTATGNYNYSLVGLDRAQAHEFGLHYPASGVPSVDDRIQDCVAIPDLDERRACWAELDRYVMEEVVPWIPYLAANRLIVTSERVDYVYDRAVGDVSFAHLSLRR